jgi:AraC-like DNA-binding protein
MRIAGRRLHREIVHADAGGSLLARDIHLPRFPFRWHYHPEVELTIIVRGSGLRFVGDAIDEFSAGDMCLLGGDCPHSWRSADDDQAGVQALVLQFSPELFAGGLLGTPEMARIGTLLERARHGVAVTGRTYERAARLVSALFAEPSGSSARLLRLLETLSCVADGGGDLCELSSGVRAMDAAAQARLGGLLAVLEGARGDLSQSTAARHLGLAPAAFSRYFHRTVGRTYAAYRTDLRIGIACHDLLGTDRTITAIAQDAGFANLSNFNRRFKTAKGMTPSAYRRLGRA